jgi:hypothetical protein
MRFVLVALALVLIPAAASAGVFGDIQTDVVNGPEWLDDAFHIGIGAAMAAGVGQVAPCGGICRAALQLAVPLAFGLCKEAFIDSDFNARDAAGYGVGALLVITIEFSVE